mgnify:CR=1 FL=1|jgi:hydroxyacylglutathione hydrolase
MFFQHIYDETLAQSSYLIGCQATGEGLVIDAKRDIDTYLEIADRQKLTITKVTETHIHADFLSGSRELAFVTGAELYLSDEGGPEWQYQFPHKGLKDGDIIQLGNLSLEVIHTPGHTPESISFLLRDHPRSDQPVMFFTGDFLFVGDIGRPDLLEEAAGLIGTKEPGARAQFRSLQKLANLPDFIQIWSAHGAGSACGKSLGAVPVSTLGYEKQSNWAFRFNEDEEGFVKFLLSGQPEAPRYFAMMKKLNKEPRRLLVEVPKHQKLSEKELKDAWEKGIKIIDTRNKAAFAQSHIPGSYNIQNNNAFSTWCGWLLNYEEQFILVASQEEMDMITRKLMRIGLDNIYGYIEQIEDLNIPKESSALISMEEMESKLLTEDVQLLDVRGWNEYQEGHIPGAEHAFAGTISQYLDKINPAKPVIIYCQAGDRAAFASSVLLANGYKNVETCFGGVKEWKAKGKSLVSSSSSASINS